MICRVITLRFDAELGGFPEEPLRAVQAEGRLLEVREHYFEHGGVPHLALLMLLDCESRGERPARRTQQDPGTELPDELKPLYRALRQWRNERAKQDGVPSYVLFRNVQLAEICRRLPRSLAELREIEGVGEATCRKYGQDLLGLIPKDLAPRKEESA